MSMAQLLNKMKKQFALLKKDKVEWLAWLGLNQKLKKKGSPKAVKSWAESYQA